MKPLISIEDLIPEEQTAVIQLKQRMAGQMDPELYDDLNLFVRFARARNLNVNAAEAMLKKHLEWRKIHKIDTILKSYTIKEVCRKYVPCNVLGIDKEGSPIIHLNFSNVDSRGILKSARKIDITKSIVHKLEIAIEMMQKQSLKERRLIDKLVVIIDFDHMPFSIATHKETLELAASLIVMYEGNYPERLKTAIFINTSFYFTLAFAVCKPFFSGPTFKKIKFFGTDGWREELNRIIDADVLPAFMGGKRTDPDGNPMCNTFLTHGGTVPQSYYIKKKGNTLANVPGTKRLLVTRMSKSQIAFEIEEPGWYLEWEFETTSRDIGFTVQYKENEFDTSWEVVVPKQRVETNVSSETGMLKCERPGVYIIEFDNSYSWIFQKELYYKINVVKNGIKVD